jgi:ATP-dependent RNA circularization protein (DNA/RNA ligase family)
MNSMPPKVLSYKTYNSIPHISSSRLGEGDHYIDEKHEKSLVDTLPNQQSLVIVQEKFDGSNVSIVRYQGELRVLSRNGYDCKNSNQLQHRMAYDYVQKYRTIFENICSQQEDRLVGEWLALAHGTRYENLDDSSVFRPFDFYREGKELPFYQFIAIVSKMGLLHYPTVLHIGGSCSARRALKLLDEKGSSSDAEGVIYRLEEGGKPKFKAKYIKHDKVDGKYLKNEDGTYKKEEEYIFNWKLSQ